MAGGADRVVRAADQRRSHRGVGQRTRFHQQRGTHADVRLREPLRVGLAGPAEHLQAVLELVEGEPLGRIRVQPAPLQVAGHERGEDPRLHAVVGGPQEVLHRIAGGGSRSVRPAPW